MKYYLEVEGSQAQVNSLVSLAKLRRFKAKIVIFNVTDAMLKEVKEDAPKTKE